MVVVTFFGSSLFVVTMWHHKRTERPKHGRGFVEGNYSKTNFRLESINSLSPLQGLNEEEGRPLRSNPSSISV